MQSGKAQPTRAAPLRLRISAAAETQVRGGHPWVFANSVRELNREAAAGELAVIYDRQDKFLAVGLFDPDSPIRVRVLHTGRPQTINRTWCAARLETAVRRRDGLFDGRTTGYRLINGESDGWPGLVLDRYDTTLVLKIYTAAWRPWLGQIVSLIRERLQPETAVLRMSRNIQRVAAAQSFPPRHEPGSGTGVSPVRIETHGRDARATIAAPADEGSLVQGFKVRKLLPANSHPGPLPLGGGEGGSSSGGARNWRDGDVLYQKRAESEFGAPIVFLESGLRFEADVVRGQKTGFFLDQRENRRWVESLARGRTVLNAFSFSGGFSLYAARGGATSVTDLDISKHALGAAARNFKLNPTEPAVADCRHELIQADAFEWLAGNAGRKFDLIVLDPPSLAKREAERAGAVRAYGKLAAEGLQHLTNGGILVACSCSAHVGAEEFFGAVRQSATRAGRKFVELRTTRHAPDHPATFKEAEYLKGIFLRLL